MKITSEALWRICYFSAGLPFYAHSLGKYSALSAVEQQRLDINEEIVAASMKRCMADVDHSIIVSYTRATENIYRKGNIFASVLAACSLTETNDLGQFTAAGVEGPLSAIMGSPYKVPAFSFHLNELTGESRGSVLRKTGTRRTFQYQFVEPAMQPFIVMRSLEQGIFTKDTFDRFQIRRGLSSRE